MSIASLAVTRLNVQPSEVIASLPQQVAAAATPVATPATAAQTSQAITPTQTSSSTAQSNGKPPVGGPPPRGGPAGGPPPAVTDDDDDSVAELIASNTQKVTSAVGAAKASEVVSSIDGSIDYAKLAQILAAENQGSAAPQEPIFVDITV